MVSWGYLISEPLPKKKKKFWFEDYSKIQQTKFEITLQILYVYQSELASVTKLIKLLILQQ